MSRIMTLPKIGVNMTEAVVDEWFVKPGDAVGKGDAIFLAETDKATQEIFATDSGIVGKLLAAQGDTVQINEPILVLLDKGEEYSDETKSAPVAEIKEVAAETKVVIAKAQTPPVIKSTSGKRVRISPLARKSAKELGLDITKLSPAEPGKRITVRDVLRFEDSAPQIPAVAMRAGSALATLQITASADKMAELINNLNDKELAVSAIDIITKASAVALRKHISVNANSDWINIGIETDVLRSVVTGADSKTVGQIKADIALADTLADATFAITDLSALEIESYVPTATAFDCATLAIGSITERYVQGESEQPKLSHFINMTLAFDGAALSGIGAARFLKELKDLVENPMLLLML